MQLSISQEVKNCKIQSQTNKQLINCHLQLFAGEVCHILLHKFQTWHTKALKYSKVHFAFEAQ